MFNNNQNNKLRLVAFFLVSIFVIGLVVLLSQLTTEDGLLKPHRAARNVTDFSSSYDGDFAFVENDVLHILLNNKETELKVENFFKTDIALSKNGDFLSFKNGSDCEVLSLPKLHTIKKENCLLEVSWLDNSTYFFFEGSGLASSDFIDESSGTMTIVNATSGERKTNEDISPNSNIEVGWGNDKTFIAIASFVDNKSRLCQLEPGTNVFLNCIEFDLALTSLKVGKEKLFAGADKEGQTVVYEIKENEIQPLNASIGLEKTEFFNDVLFVFNESNPNNTQILGLNDNSPLDYNIKTNRFHGVTKISKLSDSEYLVLAENGLWEMAIK